MTVLPKCPTCRKPVQLRATNPEFPFCSARCRAVDLGKWLGEEYKMTDDAPDDLDEAFPTFEDDGSGPRGDA